MAKRLQVAEAPSGVRKFVKIASPKPGAEVSGIVYSSAVLGINTHWIDGRTHPCLGQGRECIGHCEGIPVRWKGYLFGRSNQLHANCLFEISLDAYRGSIILQDARVSLVGAAIRLVRTGSRVNSPVRADVRLEAHPGAAPAGEPDTLAWLCRVWGIEDPRDEVLRNEGGHDS